MKAMILAAGLGSRLQPYSLKRPKPLFPILNTPLLDLTIDQLKNAGAAEIVVNAHHLRQQIQQALQKQTGIILQQEAEILGTGGGLRMALPHFGPAPVLVVNGDIYHSIDYQKVYQYHCETKADVTLVLHDYPRFNSVAVDDSLRVTGFGQSPAGSRALKKTLAFTGIHIINPEILRSMPPETAFCIIDCYRELLAMGGTVRGCLATDHFWTDIGTPADYLKLHAGLLQGNIPLYKGLVETAAEAPFVGAQTASIGKDANLLDWVCIGKGATIEAGVTLQRTVVWDDAVVPAGSIIKDAIVTP